MLAGSFCISPCTFHTPFQGQGSADHTSLLAGFSIGATDGERLEAGGKEESAPSVASVPSSGGADSHLGMEEL